MLPVNLEYRPDRSTFMRRLACFLFVHVLRFVVGRRH
jgi:hypothetical protein